MDDRISQKNLFITTDEVQRFFASINKQAKNEQHRGLCGLCGLNRLVVFTVEFYKPAQTYILVILFVVFLYEPF